MSDLLDKTIECVFQRVKMYFPHPASSNHRTFVFKGWGWEDWIANNDLYCGKRMFCLRGKKCSWHYHLKKSETFFVQSGSLLLLYGTSDDLNYSSGRILSEGDEFHLVAETRHLFYGLKDTVFFEFSTHHEESDSIRVIKGD